MKRARLILAAATLAIVGGVSACAPLGQSNLLKPSFWSGSPLKENVEAELGLAELAKGNYVTAEGHFRTALEVNPQDLDALVGAGILYQNTGQETKAREMYEAILALRPPRTRQFVVWNNVATRPISEIASVNLALLDSGQVMAGLERGAPAGQLDAGGASAMAPAAPMSDARDRESMVPPMAAGSPGVPRSVSGAAVADTPMLAGADANIVSRFKTLRALRDEGLITAEEYAARRQANIGALLPLSSPPPAAGLGRPVPSTEQITGRLRAIGRALEMRAMSVGQHAAERSMIVDALMPAAPVSVAGPTPPPQGLMEAADSVRRLEQLRDAGYISSDEYTRERTAIERAMQPPATAAAPPPKAPAPEAEVTEVATGPAVHLASYRSRRQADRGWTILRRSHRSLLEGLRPEVSEVDLGPGKGLFYRLKAGPVASRPAAEALCRALRLRRQYCQPTIL